MKANEVKLNEILEGSKQFQVPRFQRPYEWDKKQWQTLWEDLSSLFLYNCAESPSSHRMHFMGSLVTMPTPSTPEGVNTFVLIDGQQRLTTLFILLAAIRDKAISTEHPVLGSRINDLYLVNMHQSSLNQYKLLPTEGDIPDQSDLCSFSNIIQPHNINPSQSASNSRINDAHLFFSKQLRTHSPSDLECLTSTIVCNLVFVSIVVDPTDNPHLIFESLNAKGRRLDQSDLIRNYFFMRLPNENHEEIYKKYWQPMENLITSDNMTEFMRHFLMQNTGHVKQGEVYFFLKSKYDTELQPDLYSLLRKLCDYSLYYSRLINPENEPSLN